MDLICTGWLKNSQKWLKKAKSANPGKELHHARAPRLRPESTLASLRVANLLLPIVPSQATEKYQIDTNCTKAYEIQITYLIYLELHYLPLPGILP